MREGIKNGENQMIGMMDIVYLKLKKDHLTNAISIENIKEFFLDLPNYRKRIMNDDYFYSHCKFRICLMGTSVKHKYEKIITNSSMIGNI